MNNDYLINKESVTHFIGAGGIGMSGLARSLLSLGFKVSGSDTQNSDTLSSLSDMRGKIFVGHSENNIENASCIVVSSAIKEDNPEIVLARKKNIPVLHRSQVLNMLMEGLGLKNKQTSIGVSGTHGKTTTSGMISFVFEYSGLDPSFVVGGKMPHLKTNSKVGKGNFFIAELDESDGTVEVYSPDITVLTNLEYDHPDYYTEGFEQLLNTFKRYIDKLDKKSKIIINIDCPGNRQLLTLIKHPGIICYSTDDLNTDAEYYVQGKSTVGLNSGAKVYRNKEYIGTINIPIPGAHNISNALGTIAAAMECGIEFKSIAESLSKFTGMRRRFEIVGEINGAKIIDDYAHHPTEIKATLNAAKKVIKSKQKGKVTAIFQPHRYTRLSNLWDDFLACFDDADEVFICDVYSAGESPILDISSQKLVNQIKNNNIKYLSGNIEQISDKFTKNIEPDDIILTIGAGDITKLGNLLVKKNHK